MNHDQINQKDLLKQEEKKKSILQ